MHRKRQLSVPASLDVIPFARAADDPDSIGCPDCGMPLDTHQPDVDSPDRLVGVCLGCRRWYMILADPGEADVLMVLLPDRQWFRAIPVADGSPGPPEPE